MMSRLLVAATIVGVGAAGYALGTLRGGGSSDAAGPSKRAASAEITAAKRTRSAERAPLTREVMQIRTVERLVERDPAPPEDPQLDEPDNESEAAHAEREATAQAEAEAMEREVHAKLDSRFEAQDADRAWAGEMEATLRNTLRSLEPNSGVRFDGVECRLDLCKSTLTHDSTRPPQEFIMGFAMKALPGLETRFRYGDGRTTIYSLRRDDSLTPAE